MADAVRVVLDRAVGVDQRRSVFAVQTTVTKPFLATVGKDPRRSSNPVQLTVPSRHSSVPSAAIAPSVLVIPSFLPVEDRINAN
jgi:hypothetical protein